MVEDSIECLRDCGAVIVDDVALPTQGEMGAFTEGSQDVIYHHEFKAGLNRYLKRLGPGAAVKCLDDVIAFNCQHAAEVMPYFGQDQFLKAQAAGSLSDPRYLAARNLCSQMAGRDGIDRALAEQDLDVLFAPTIGAPWKIDLVNGDHRPHCCSTPAASAGYPHVTLPGGFLHDLPIGVSFFAGKLSDTRLLHYAYAFEQASGKQRVPALALQDTAEAVRATVEGML